MKVDILTIFPKMFKGFLCESILGRAQKQGLLEVTIHDLRDWTTDSHRSVDDRPFGGGPGMVMMIEPIAKALAELKAKDSGSGDKCETKAKVLVMSAKGKLFSQNNALALSKEGHLIIIAPHYEGIDERVIQQFADFELSIGPYVLTGGELPALVVLDATARLIPGIVGKQESVEMESFATVSVNGKSRQILEYPQYTRPEVFKTLGEKELKVPEVLLSGNHEEICKWRLAQTKIID